MNAQYAQYAQTRSRAAIVPGLILCALCAAGRPARAQEPAADMLAAVRGAGPLLCEMAVRTIESQWGWSWGWDVRRKDVAVRATLERTSRTDSSGTAVPMLRAALSDSDACVRRLAAPLLGRTRHPSARAALRAALQDTSVDTREAAAYGLGYSEDASVIPALLAGLQDAVPRVRVASAWALGSIEDRRAIGALVRVLREDRDPEVRAAAAWALGEIEG